ncbi:MAG TPA: hypothetical protein VFB41_06515 [Solirubrobacteraceae bacterium]|nr:hypothetical protein [Solirubrobacteraceae bacterium]
MSTAPREERQRRPGITISDVACLLGLVAFTAAFWVLVVVGLVALL